MKKYLKFIICFLATPTTFFTYLLADYMNIYLAYLISCLFLGTILYFINKK